MAFCDSEIISCSDKKKNVKTLNDRSLSNDKMSNWFIIF